jgi:O-antigen/teichoic acid export membrane protein
MLSSSSVQMTKKKVFKIYSNFHWFVSIIGTFIFIFIAINSFWILEFWIKKDFAIKYNYLFQLACLQGVFASFTVVPHFSSFGLGKPSNNLWEASLTASLVIVLSLIMIPIIGVLGAAISQLIAYVLVVIFIQIQIKKTIFSEFNLIEFFRPILPSILIGCCLFLFLFYLSFKNVFISFTFINFVILNLLIVFIIIMVVMAEKYFNKNSGRYQIFIDALAMLKEKILHSINFNECSIFCYKIYYRKRN